LDVNEFLVKFGLISSWRNNILNIMCSDVNES
jgi:hypothetical protein